LGEQSLLLLRLLVEEIKDVPHHLLSNVYHRVEREPLSLTMIASSKQCTATNTTPVVAFYLLEIKVGQYN